MDFKVAVSIVTYNSEKIFQVLDNIRTEFSGDNRFKFLIFDNNSEEDYKNKLRKYEDIVEINFYHENNGFGFGHNANLLNRMEKYFLVFNPDIILKKDSLLKLVEIMEQSSTIGLTVPKVLNADGSIQYLVRDQVSVFDYALRFIPFKFVKKMFNKRLAKFECRDLSDTENTEIRIGSGCFMLLRDEAFKAIKGFDDRYFMYFEDYDLCLELHEKNYKIIYNPFSEVIHFYEKGAHKNRQLFKIFMQSMRLFFNKWGWKFF
ncbi:glycosyltransferase family 2 protein [Carnobacterium gallinarum]|uniref:glycosyltransferase family 2 protein n=1 Tax=Carnobacterium gallinarum TaxID=2749 RepID=UPI0005507B3E|nr:glycosyltransferase family 2 protein [Carnobacterium gallinarum]